MLPTSLNLMAVTQYQCLFNIPPTFGDLRTPQGIYYSVANADQLLAESELMFESLMQSMRIQHVAQ